MLRRVIEAWALLGGALLLAVVLMNVMSVVGGAMIGRPFPGDFELTEVGVCVAAFAFLPYCQLSGANVTADIFTARVSARGQAVLSLVASLVGFAFACLLGWRMYAGMIDQKAYGYTTAIVQFPHWMAFVPILVSLALLAVAAGLSFADAGRVARDG